MEGKVKSTLPYRTHVSGMRFSGTADRRTAHASTDATLEHFIAHRLQ